RCGLIMLNADLLAGERADDPVPALGVALAPSREIIRAELDRLADEVGRDNVVVLPAPAGDERPRDPARCGRVRGDFSHPVFPALVVLVDRCAEHCPVADGGHVDFSFSHFSFSPPPRGKRGRGHEPRAGRVTPPDPAAHFSIFNTYYACIVY